MYNEQHAAILTYFRFTSQTFWWKFRWLINTYELRIFSTQSIPEKLRFHWFQLNVYNLLYFYQITFWNNHLHTHTRTTLKLQIEWKNKVFSWDVVKFSLPCDVIWSEMKAFCVIRRLNSKHFLPDIGICCRCWTICLGTKRPHISIYCNV